MTPSIEERREAAANLKSLTGVVPRGDNDAAGFIEALDDVLFDFGPNELGDIANRLADLIEPLPERTCRMKLVDATDALGCKMHRCSACGALMTNRDCFFLDGRTDDVEWFSYCPNCGAKVVER